MDDGEGGLSFDFEGGLDSGPAHPTASVPVIQSAADANVASAAAASNSNYHNSAPVGAAQTAEGMGGGGRRSFRQTVCRHWLRSLCMKGDACGFLHQYDKSRMPVCRFFRLYGECREQDCVYKHTNEDIKECNMYKLGFCPNGPDCRYRPNSMSSQSIIIIIFCFNSLFTISAQPIKPDSYPDPSAIQTQILNSTAPATIPAFPEQSQASVCPLNLPENLFHDIDSACGAPKTRHDKSDPNFYSGQYYRNRCCPVLAAWLYSAYAETGLSLATTKTKDPSSETTPFDMPDLPDDSETCVNNLEKALDDKGVGLQRVNDTCDSVFCNCGIRLHPFSCPEAFRVNKRGKLVAGEAVKRLETNCYRYGRGSGIGACSNCLNTLYSLKADKSERSNTSDRIRKMHDQDCELMGLTWLLNKNRSAYIDTVSAVLRALMMNSDKDSDPAFCSLNSDGMPLAVDSSEINNQSLSTVLATRLYHLLLPISLFFCTSVSFFSSFPRN